MKTNCQNPYFRNLSTSIALFAAGLLVALGTPAAFAAPATWNVTTDGDWSLATNWNPDVPGLTGNNSTTDTAGFGGATNYKVHLSGTRSISTQTFSNTGTTALLGGTSTTAANEFLYLYNGFTVNAGSGAVTIGDTAVTPTRKVDIRMGTYTIANNSTSVLTLANGLQSRGTGTTTIITLGGSGPITVSGVVGGGLGAAVALSKTGGNTVTLSGVNTFSGGLTLSGATANSQLNINSTKALGGGTFTISGGDNAKINNTSGGAITNANNNPQTWSNDFAFVGSNDLNMGTGTITLGGNRQVTVTTKNLTLGGVITDGTSTFGLTKAGNGTLILTNANTYDGTTTVSAGVLRPTHADALGSTTGGTTASGGSLELTSGLTPNTAEVLTISGSGADFVGALRAGTGGGTWAGPIAIGTAGARLGATAGNTLTVTGSIANGAANALAISGQSGTGVVVINPAAPNTYTGKTDIVRGILRLGRTDALPTGTILDVDAASGVGDPAVFDLASFSQTAAGLQDSAGDNLSGKVTNSVASTASILTLNQTANTTFDGIIENGSGSVALVKGGGGTLTLNGANTYSGDTSLNVGRLNINGAFASNVNAAAGVTLSFGGTSSTSALNMAAGSYLAGEGTITGTGSLTFGTGTNTLIFNADTAGALTVPSVTATGATVMVAPQGTLTTGNTYVVLTNSAGFPGTPAATYTPSSRGTLAFGGPLAGELPTELQFTAAAPVTTLTWKGNASPSNQWDINTTANWDNGSGADVFFDLDSVAFDDSAADTTITIQPATVNVGALSFNNPTKDYSISGGGITGTATLVKDGNAALTLANANSFTGGTTLNAGTLNINHATALGTAAGTFLIAGGAIDNTSGTAITTPSYPIVIDADIAFAGSYDLNLGAGATTLGASAGTARTITTTAGTLRLGGAIADGSGGANEIVKAGNGTLTLAGASTYTGLTTVSGGTLKLGASGTSATSCPLGTTAAGTSVASGATLDFGGFKAYAEAITIIGTGVGGSGALINSGAEQIYALESLTLAGNASIGGNGNRFDVRTNSVPATLNLADFTLTKSGTNAVALVGTTVTPGTGHIDITGGTFSIQTTTTMNGSAANTITVRDGATLNCYQSGAWTAPTWSVLMDAGSSFTNSNGTAIWDGTVTLNGAATAGGAGSLTLNGVVGGASGALTKIGVGRLTLTQANTYAAGTTVNGGTLYLDSATTPAILGNVAVNSSSITAERAILILARSNQLESTANVTMNLAGTGLVYADFALKGNTQTIASINATWDAGITGNVFIGNRIYGETGGGDGVLTINGSSNSDLGSKVIIRDGGSGTLSLVKAGSGTLSIGGANTYTGTTTVNGGTLALSGSLAAGSAVTVGGASATGTPTLTGNGTVNGSLTIAAASTGAAGIIDPGSIGGIGTLNVKGTILAGTFACDIDATTSDSLAVTGNLDLSGATLAFNPLATPTASSYTLATYTGTLNGNPFTTVSGLPTGYSLVYATTGVIKLVKNGFAGWIADNYPALSDKSAGGDPDHDGMKNLLEYVLNANPGTSDPQVPAMDSTSDPLYVIFTFNRLAASTGDTTQIFQYGSTLDAWTGLNLTGTLGAGVTIGAESGGMQPVTVKVPKAAAVGGKIFGRLEVTQP